MAKTAKKPSKPKPAVKKKPAPKKGESEPRPKGKPQDFRIDMVKFERELQPRQGDGSSPIGGLFAFHVEDLRRAIRAGEDLPRARIWSVAGRGNLAADGHHTIEAYRLEGRKTFPAEVFEGSWLDAVKDASQANAQHLALKRTHEDKRNAVTNLLNALAEAGEDWSNMRVAQWCKVSDDLVKAVRVRIPQVPEKEPEDGKPSEPAKRVGRDGKSYSAKKKPKTKAEPAPVATAARVGLFDRPAAGEPAKVNPEYDLNHFDSLWGGLLREVDNLGRQYSAIQGSRPDGLRKLAAEFKDDFHQWHKELVAKYESAKGKP